MPAGSEKRDIPDKLWYNPTMIIKSQRRNEKMETKKMLIKEITDLLKECDDLSLIRMIYLILLKG